MRDGSFHRIPGKVSPWTKVGDCNQYDDRSLATVRIRAALMHSPAGNGSLSLEARDHAACVSQSPQPHGYHGYYRLTLSYRSLSGQPPRVCLFAAIGDDERCVGGILGLRVDRDWSQYSTILGFPSRMTSLSLFLYAFGNGDTTTRIIYDDVSLRRLSDSLALANRLAAHHQEVRRGGGVRGGRYIRKAHTRGVLRAISRGDLVSFTPSGSLKPRLEVEQVEPNHYLLHVTSSSHPSQ